MELKKILLNLLSEQDDDENEFVSTNPYKLRPKIIPQDKVIKLVRGLRKFKIMYMQHAVPRENVYFTPYYLEIVDFSQINHENYMTITPCGVSQYTKEVVFTWLDEWEQEYNMFTSIAELKFFKHFLIWKAYYVWRKSIVFKKYRLARNRIKKFLFFENRVLVVALLAIQGHCCDMYMESFSDLTVDMDINFFYFLEYQIRRWEYLRDRLIKYREDVHTILVDSCHKSLFLAGFTWDDSNFPPLIQKYGKWVGGMTYTEKANKRKFCERLGCYVKLVDYMKNYMLYRLNKRSYTKMSEMFQIHSDFTPDEEKLDSVEHDIVLEIVPRNINRCKWALFQLEADITPDGTVILIPASEVLCHYMETITEYWDDCIRVFENYLNDESLEIFVQPHIMGKKMDWTAGESPNLYFMMNQDHSMLDHMTNVLRTLNYGFDCVWRFMARFDDLVAKFVDDVAMDIEAMKAEESLPVIRSWIINCYAQMDAVYHIQLYQPLGIFFLSLELMKDNYLPQPRRLLNAIMSATPELARRVIDELLELSEKLHANIEFVPITLEEKEEYDFTIVETERQLTFSEDRFEYLRDLFDMLGEFNMPIDPEDFEEYLSLSVALGRMRNTLTAKLEIYRPDALEDKEE